MTMRSNRRVAPLRGNSSRRARCNNGLASSTRSHTSASTSTATTKSTMTYTSAASTLSQQQVDELAQALQISVSVETRKCKNTRKRYKQCFVGSEAVDIILQLARLETRRQALEVGRLLQSSLSLFECVNSAKVYKLQDDDRLFYRFTNDNTSAEVPHKDIPQLEEKMRIFQRNVQLKDRFLPYYYTTYKNCFVGREAVDLMMKHQMASTREECVEIGRILQSHYNLFTPVTGNHDFEDDSFKFYRLLLPQKDEKKPSLWEEIKPARFVIALSLIPACLTYYYFY